MDACHKFQNVQDPSILSWSGELLTPELYERYKDMLPKEKGLLGRNFLEIFLTIFVLEIIQVKTPPVFEKAFSPPTAPCAMSAPVLAARLSLPVQGLPTSLLQRISQTRTPSPIAPEIDTPPQGSPA